MADIATLKIRYPSFRIKVVLAAVWVLSRLVRNQAAVGRAYDALLNWAMRGLKVSIH